MLRGSPSSPGSTTSCVRRASILKACTRVRLVAHEAEGGLPKLDGWQEPYRVVAGRETFSANITFSGPCG
jgi:hypothetical protein